MRKPKDGGGLQGTVKLTWPSPTGRTLAVVEDDARRRVLVVSQNLRLVRDERVNLAGQWTEHVGAGRCLVADSKRTLAPDTVVGSAHFLSSALEADFETVNRLISRFGDELLEVLDDGVPRRLTDAGVPTAQAKTMLESWRRHRSHAASQPLMNRLGLGAAEQAQLRTALGVDTDLDGLIRDNPYAVILHVPGADWYKVEGLASELKRDQSGRERIEAGIIETLRRQAYSGHTYMPMDFLKSATARLLREDGRGGWARRFEAAFDKLRADRFVTTDSDRVFLPAMFEEAGAVAETVLQHCNRAGDIDPPDDIDALGFALQSIGAPWTSDSFALGRFALGASMGLITVRGYERALQVCTQIAHIGAVLKLKVATLAVTEWAAEALRARGCPGNCSTLDAELVRHEGKLDFGKLGKLDAKLIVVVGADQLSSLDVRRLLMQRPSDTGLVLIGDPDVDSGFVMGRAFIDLVAAAKAKEAGVRVLDAGGGGAVLDRLGVLLADPERSAKVVGRFDLPVSILPVAQNTTLDSAIARYVREVVPTLPAETGSLVVGSPRRSAIDDVESLSEHIRRALATGSPPEPIVIGERRFHAGDPIVTTAPLEGDVTLAVNAELTLAQSLDQGGPYQCVSGSRTYMLRADQLAECIAGWVLPTHRLLWRRVETVVMAVPTGKLAHGRRLIYSMAAAASKRLVLAGSPDAIAEVLGAKEGTPHSLLRLTLVGRSEADRLRKQAAIAA